MEAIYIVTRGKKNPISIEEGMETIFYIYLTVFENNLITAEMVKVLGY
jgi:hypothetical protein